MNRWYWEQKPKGRQVEKFYLTGQNRYFPLHWALTHRRGRHQAGVWQVLGQRPGQANLGRKYLVSCPSPLVSPLPLQPQHTKTGKGTEPMYDKEKVVDCDPMSESSCRSGQPDPAQWGRWPPLPKAFQLLVVKR